ncbi:MAG TPA: hypothetical protein DGT21_17915 [Armatimonadetes bacterium]|nr:hypothetical protein [Armatimonadota bacterium]
MVTARCVNIGTRHPWILVWAALAMLAGRCAAQQEQMIAGFESDAELRDWELSAAGTELVSTGATQGQNALQLEFDPQGRWYPVTLFWNRVIRDWSPWDALIVDVYNPMDRPVSGALLVADQAWADGGRSYWNRHNSATTFAPGQGRWVIPVRGLYRGEAGSRNNDIKRDIDIDQIIRLDLNFGSKGESGRIIVDNIRFVKVDRPDDVWAFDFGPPSQAVMLGWREVSNATGYAPELGYGWGPTGGKPWDGAARDTTFGPMLTRDFCQAGGYNFHVDVPRGRYSVLVIYENSGYWGGEQALHTRRSISVDGQVVYDEQRPDGASTPLYRFEDTEPIGVDLWDTYMAAELARPVRFETTAGDAGLTLHFEADVPWGSKVSALSLHRADDAQAAAWLEGQLSALADEFRAQAVCLDPEPQAFDAPAGWSERGLVAWPVSLDEDIAPHVTPTRPPAPDALRLSADAVRGEYEPVCLAVRPLRDLGECTVVLEAPAAEGISADARAVWYNTSRGFGTIAYHVSPHTLRPVASIDMPADVTREFVVTFSVGENAMPGEHQGTLRLVGPDGAELLTVPITLTVHDVLLGRETDFLMGFFGLLPPERLLPGDAAAETLEQSLDALREHGMNALCGGPSWRLTGWDNGRPRVDFGGVDDFFALCRAHGFDRPILGYGGLRFAGLHQGYQKGDVGEKVEQESGLDYQTALMRAWGAVDEHARANDWPTILYGMCDETRVADIARRELEFMQMMARVSERFPRTVRTSGSYSVHFRERPTDESDLLLWHQRFFEALDISSLNNHDQTVIDEAARLGKQVHIYNQGRTRHSFGLYQWSEYCRGVRARWQWHFNILHGYQFFDLDGREPDTAMVCYGREGLYPTIHFERCREGAEDFYLYQTLRNATDANAATGRNAAATAAARALLERMTGPVALNQRTPPDGYNAHALKLQVVAALKELQ